MKAFELRKTFGLEALTPTERPDPSPGPGQVLLRLRAASLNYRDLLMVQGLYNPKQPLPLIPLSDGVGEVVRLGDGVTRVKEGDRVAGIFAQKWLAGEPTRQKLLATLGGPLDGMLADHIVLHEEGMVPVPAHLSDEEAATLPCAAVTAWSALVTQGGLKAGDTLLVLGTGGVSLFALQFARLFGARVIVTSSSDEKLARARQLGASDLINYKATPDWEKKVKELTGGVGADHVLEVGGSGTLPRSLRAVRVGGHISLIGNLTGLTADLNLAPILMQNVRVQGVMVGSRETFETMNRAIGLHKLHPVLDRVFPFAEARAAFEHLAGQGHFGKIGIRI
ncbi:MAG TPA: NAD(P)-dependent alcohol dehydrogenase [Vicinamibacteria bacterium]|jgi:NADPH:quinone reductase-like Zn-dependent oxidoreductase|nr:NAD(P)-dependent alcohol dehydrogenase [Vicinamibacteria bacterium]